MLTNKEVLKLQKKVQKKSNKNKIVLIRKNLNLSESIKKQLCKIIVSYMVRNKMTSLELSKQIKMYKNQMERASLYQYDSVSFEFLIEAVEKISKIDQSSCKKVNQLIKILN